MSDYNPHAFSISVTLFIDKSIPQKATYERLRRAMLEDGNPKLDDMEIFNVAEGKGVDKAPKTSAEARMIIAEYGNANAEAGG
jgi:hypothetical protein